MSNRWVLYGATGYTGRRLLEAALDRGMPPVVAGRSEAGLEALRRSWRQRGHELEIRPADLADRPRLNALLKDSAVVLNAAGPYAQTAAPVVEACLRTGTHYLDISGELPAIVGIAAEAASAQRGGVMLMPAVGYAVAPTDCLAVRACRFVSTPVRLRIALSHFELFAAGSAKSMVALVADQVSVRREGEMTTVPVGQLEADFDFGEGLSRTTAINWSDAFTAYFSTGVPNIEVYLEASAMERWLYRLSSQSSPWIQQPVVQALLGSSADLWFSRHPEDLNRALEAKQRCVVVEATDPHGAGVQFRLTTPEPYRVTCDTALTVVERVLRGEWRAGFCTPGMVYGDDLLAAIAGARAERRAVQQ